MQQLTPPAGPGTAPSAARIDMNRELPERERQPEPANRNRSGNRADNYGMTDFEHERLDVYRTAIEFLGLADAVAGSLPKGRAYLADQLRRSSASIPLNIAEGAGEYAAADKARFYRMARRSATESAAILDACRSLKLADFEQVRHGRELLLRIVAMLTPMVLRINASGSGSRAGSGSS